MFNRNNSRLVAGALTLTIHAAVVLAFIAVSFASPSGRGNPRRRQALQVILLPASDRPEKKRSLADDVPRENRERPAIRLGHEKALVSMRSETKEDQVKEEDAAAAAPTDVSTRAEFLSYRRRLLEHLRPFHSYPESLRERGVPGVVLVGFMMRRDGAVREAWIETSSGSDKLDEAALATVRKAQPLPGIPAGLPDTLVMTIPLSYSPRYAAVAGSPATP